MKITRRIALLCLFAGSTMWGPSVRADGPPGGAGVQPASAHAAGQVGSLPHGGPIRDYHAGRAVLRNTVGIASAEPFGPMIHLDGVFGQGQGWDGDLFRVESFVPWHLDPGRDLLFLSLNGGVDGQGKGVGLFTGGYRIHVPRYDRVFTIAGFFDVDDGEFNTYERAGFHFASLGRYLDFMMNGYAIVGEDTDRVDAGFTGGVSFSGHNVLLGRFQNIESAYSGMDFLVGGPVPVLGHYGLKVYAGAHWLHSPDNDDAYGPDFLIHQQFNDDVSVGVNVSHDEEFGTNTFVTLSMTLPNGKTSGWMQRWMRPRPVPERLADRPIRSPRIPTKLRHETLPGIAALDPDDGAPLQIFFIREGASPGGTGTFEDPAPGFAPLQAAGPSAQSAIDIVLVAGSQFQTNGTFTVQPGQRLLSTAIPQFAETNIGVVGLPGTGSGVFPLVTDAAGGDVFRLSSGSEISAFIVDGSGTGRPIVGDDIAGFNLNHNRVRNSFDHGIVLVNATGTFTGETPGLVLSNIITDNPSDGLQIINNAPGGGELDLLISGNTVANNGPTNAGAGIRLEAHNGNVINADPAVVAQSGVIGNAVVNNGTGIRAETFTGGTINLGLVNNDVRMNRDAFSGVSVNANGPGSAVRVATMTGNTITDNSGFGFSGTAAGGGLLTLSGIFGNAIDANAAGNMRLQANGAGSTVVATIGGPGLPANTFNGSQTGAGIELVSTGGTMFVGIHANMIGTAASPNATFGVFGQFDGGVSNVTIGGPTPDFGNMILSDGTASNTGVAMVYGNSTETLFAPQFDSGHNIIQDFGSTGVNLSVQSADTQLTANMTLDAILGNGSNTAAGGGLIVSNNAGDPDGDQLPGAIALTVAASNISINEGGNGATLNANNFGHLDAMFDQTLLEFNGSPGNPANGIEANANGNAALHLTVERSVIRGNFDPDLDPLTRPDGDGIQVNVNTADDLNATAHVAIGRPGFGNEISGNRGDGIEFNQGSAGSFGRFAGVNVASNNISGNDGNGILYDSDLTVQYGTPFTGIFEANTIQFNSLAGFRADIRQFNGTRDNPTFITLNRNSITSNGRDGVRIVTDTDRVRPTTVGVNAVEFVSPAPGPQPHDPNAPEFMAQLADEEFNPPYLSLLSDINVQSTVVNNTIVNNGTSGIVGEQDGAAFLVGTDTYQAVNFSENRAEGNLGADFHTGSFRSGNPPNQNTPDTFDVGGIDTLTLDATAQLDLRFLGNRLNTMNLSTDDTNAAFFTNPDPGKNFTPSPWTAPGDAFDHRPAFLYRVESAGQLDGSNVLIGGGMPTSVSQVFQNGRYFLDPDTLWPDPDFPNNAPSPAPSP